MDWDQIESKWAAMTRRVRADVQYAPLSLRPRQPRRTPTDLRSGATVDRLAGGRVDARSTLPQE